MSNDLHNIQWFPGHMAKTRRLIQENTKVVDMVAEIVDARIPLSSRNPELDQMVDRQKPRLMVLNKSDLADANATQKWLDYFKSQGIAAIATDAKSGRGMNTFAPAVAKALAEKRERQAGKGMQGILTRVMIVGVPNVGKSSFINNLAGKKRARVEDRPGVTRGKQWIKVTEDLELLDMPGVLWPKFEDPAVGDKLAFTGAIKDQIMDMEDIAFKLLNILKDPYANRIAERFKLTPEQVRGCEDGWELLQLIGRKRGMLVSGGEIDTERASIMFVDEYRGSKLGRITLEHPPTEGEPS